MLSLLYFLAGAALTYLVSRPGLELLQRLRRHITWRSFRIALEATFHEHFASAEWRPDVIIGLNSGIVSASILALNLRVPQLLFYQSHPSYDRGRRNQPEIQDKDINLAGKNLLIVDDQAYTGKSMELLRTHLIEKAAAEPNRIKRYAVFSFRSAAGPVDLEIPPGGYVLGSLKRVPWVFAKELEPFWKQREPA